MPRVVKSWLIPWEPDVPGIAFTFDDGFEVSSDARSNGADVLDAIELLSEEDRTELAVKLEAGYAVYRPRH